MNSLSKKNAKVIGSVLGIQIVVNLYFVFITSLKKHPINKHGDYVYNVS